MLPLYRMMRNTVVVFLLQRLEKEKNLSKQEKEELLELLKERGTSFRHGGKVISRLINGSITGLLNLTSPPLVGERSIISHYRGIHERPEADSLLMSMI